MEALLSIVGNIWAAVIDANNGLLPLMISTPILLFPIGFVFAAKTVSLTKRLLGTGGRRR